MSKIGRMPRGMGLVEVLVGFVLVALLSAGIMRMMSGSMKGARNVASAVGHQMMKGNLMVLLANPEVCMDTFTGVPFGATNTLTVKRGTSVLIQQGAEFDGMTVSRLQANVSPIGASSVALATVTLETTRNAGSQMAGATKTETAYVNLLTNGTSLVRCAGTDTVPQLKLLQTGGLDYPTNGLSFTSPGSYPLGFRDYTPKGNFLRAFPGGTVLAAGSVNDMAVRMRVANLSTGAWLEPPPGSWICSQRGQGVVNLVNSCLSARNYNVVPGQVYRFELEALVGIVTPISAGHGIAGNFTIVIDDYLTP